MKKVKRYHLSICSLLLSIFFFYLAPCIATAQEDTTGITAYSDTTGGVSSLFPMDPTNQEDNFFSNTSDQSTGISSNHQFYWTFDHEETGQNLFSLLFNQVFQWGIVFVIIFFLILIVFPLLILAGIIYLIYRLTHNNPSKTTSGESTSDPSEIRHQLQQQAIQLGILGIGLLLIEYLFGLFHIAGIVGIIVICIAIGQWLSNRNTK